MRPRWWGWLLVLIGVLVGFGRTSAQAMPIDEQEYWRRLEQTALLLAPALRQPNPTEILAPARVLWENVQEVQLANETITVDLNWLTGPLAEGDSTALQVLQRHIQALLDEHARQIAISSDQLSQSALDEVLQDSRFHYTEVTPTPRPDQSSPDLPNLNLSSGLSQFLLIIAGVALVVVVFLYFSRNLTVQPAALDHPAASDEPTSSGGAADLASELAASGDYRAAVRYLYLSSLLLLDERGLIRYDATLTNREHLRQIQGQPQLLETLRQVINIFEDVWYGYAPVDAAVYQQYCHHLNQLRRFVP